MDVINYLLDHPDTRGFENAHNCLLDMRSWLMGGEARSGIDGYIKFRALTQHRFPLELLRLRRWLENHVSVISWQKDDKECDAVFPFEGGARSLSHLESYYRSRFFEFHPEARIDKDIQLDFRVQNRVLSPAL